MIEFFKLEALGNDFVLVDARAPRSRASDLTPADARRLADRRRGIGCDQVLVLQPSANAGEFGVRIRNADGSEAEQCGNGMRALAAWLDRVGELGPGVVVETAAGDVGLGRSGRGEYTADLPGPVDVSADQLRLPPLPRLPWSERASLVSMGNPHLIVLVDTEPDPELLARHVAELEREPSWRNAVNLGLCRARSPERVTLRVHERGAGPTPACGSAACAAAWSVGTRLAARSPLAVEQPGGSLVVDWRRRPGRVLTAGPATVVFQGRIE
jgi:diaminopimelate epimerase